MNGYEYPSSLQTLAGLYYTTKENDVRHDNFDDKDPKKEPFYSFVLPEDDYGEAMAARRLAPEGSHSPPALPQSESSGSASGTRRQSTIEDTEGKPSASWLQLPTDSYTIDPKSSAASTPRQSSIRGTRNRPRGGSQLKEVSVPITVRGRLGRTNPGPKKGDQGTPDQDNDKDEAEEATPKNAPKSVSKSSGSKVSRRSVRKR